MSDLINIKGGTEIVWRSDAHSLPVVMVLGSAGARRLVAQRFLPSTAS